MNDNDASAISDARLLAAMEAVNPPIEMLMADRLRLRNESRKAKAELDEAQIRLSALQHFRDVQLPSYIARAKLVSLFAAAVLLASLAIALFTRFLDITTTASLFASLVLPLWLVDLAERKFGRWELRLRRSAVFVSDTLKG